MTDPQSQPGKTLEEVARSLDLLFSGNAEVPIRGVADLEHAGPDDLVFVRDASHLAALERSKAGAAIVPEGCDPGSKPAIYSTNPRLDFARAIAHVRPAGAVHPGVDPGAHVAPDAAIHETARIGAGASVGERCRVGAGCVIHPNATLYPDVTMGDDCTIHSGVVIREECELGNRVILQPGAVIGGDGFGYEPDSTGALQKVPQVGKVVLGDDVEVGSNTTIDRAALFQTRIGDRTKLDNLIQVAHNVEIGEDVVVAAQSGFSGSTRIGRGTIVMAQVGVAGHLEIGTRAFLGARAGLHKSVADHARVYGTPQMEERAWHRAMAALKRLPSVFKRLRAIERKLGIRDDGAD